MPKVGLLGKVEWAILVGMVFPKKVPGLRWLTAITAVYGVVWIGLEGNLGRVILLGMAVSLMSVVSLMQRFVGGRMFGEVGWLVVTGGGGLLTGMGSGISTFVFMALKTGLHSHGPEFKAAEIEWVLKMIPLWGVAGLLAGLGIGVLVWGMGRGGLGDW
ncbi:MAG: hypothetical protein WAM60_06130 [Candidatus Promineifilaceae bacterium]